MTLLRLLALASVSACAATADTKTVTLEGAKGNNAPFTWAIIYRNPADPEKGKKVVDFLRWGLTRGQQYEAALNYARLPDAMVSRILQRLDSVQVAKK